MRRACWDEMTRGNVADEKGTRKAEIKWERTGGEEERDENRNSLVLVQGSGRGCGWQWEGGGW